MLERCRGIACAVVIMGAMSLLLASPAAAVCVRYTDVYDTGTLTATGSTCSDAQFSLGINLQGTANANCQALYGQYASAYNLVETLDGCQPDGIYQMATGSAQYQCQICGCFGPRCT